MSEFTSSFWAGWVAGIVILSLVWLGVLLYQVYFGKRDEHDSTVWDENLREGANAPPLWWFALLFSTMIFGAIYLTLYPGLGNNAGALKWSSGHQLEETRARYDREFGPLFARWQATPVAELAHDELAMQTATNVYQNHCASCHGADARGGANLFPNLADDEWIWGSSEAQLHTTLLKGRRAVMPGWLAILQQGGVEATARYVAALGRGEADAPEHVAGKQHYTQYCVACHGADAGGNPALGAPALNDNVWLYGGDLAAITYSIANGRQGHMPAQENRLTDTEIHLLVAWLLSEYPRQAAAY